MSNCTHKNNDGSSAIVYDSLYEMRSNEMHCTLCGKEGSREELETNVCKKCDGSGKVYSDYPSLRAYEIFCPKCKGTGKDII